MKPPLTLTLDREKLNHPVHVIEEKSTKERKDKEMRKLRKNEGFTLAELLIVVAIIAVLVAISIPIFTTQLEKAREATDEANLRSLYAETVAAVLIEDTSASTTIPGAKLKVTKDKDTGVVTGTATLPLKQQKAGLEGGVKSVNIGGVNIRADQFGPNKKATITVSADEVKIEIA